MVLLDITHEHPKFIDILPYIKNGIIIDTSVMKIFIDGFISTEFSHKDISEYGQLISLFEFINIIKRGDKKRYYWNKFLITPHIFTEICSHINNDYHKHHNYNKIIETMIPILKEIKENQIDKNKILDYIDIKNPIVEIGDVSIFLTIKNYEDGNEKIAVLEKDGKFLEKYGDSSNKKVMVIDFNITISDMKRL